MLALARELGFLPTALADPRCEAHTWEDLPVFRADDEAISTGFDAAILAIDDPSSRERAFERYRSAGIAFLSVTFTEPGAGTSHGESLLVQRLANLSVDCTLGHGVRLNTGANVMHNVTLGDFVTVAPNAVLLANVTVGALSYVGANATVLQGITIGRGSMIGAGAVVTRDVSDGVVVKGNPARPA